MLSFHKADLGMDRNERHSYNCSSYSWGKKHRSRQGIQRVISWLEDPEDPEASGVDSLTFDWSPLRFYAFLPFSIISDVFKNEGRECRWYLGCTILVNQTWIPLIFKMLTDAPVALTYRKHLLHLSYYSQTLHPIWRKVYHLAGSSHKTAGYLKKLPASSKHHENPQQGKDIRAQCTNSRSIAYKGIQY